MTTFSISTFRLLLDDIQNNDHLVVVVSLWNFLCFYEAITRRFVLQSFITTTPVFPHIPQKGGVIHARE
jgi:hypothetical protein